MRRNLRLTVTAVSLLILISSVHPASAQATYNYRRPVVIDHNKVPRTDQANFPVLISGTYSYLATVANGGKVQNTNGWDIVFTSDAAGTNNLGHQLINYHPHTSTLNFPPPP